MTNAERLREAFLKEKPIINLEDIVQLLRLQAEMRSLENDERGILIEAADFIDKERGCP